MKYPVRIALVVAIALAQIGEFSFIVAALGEQLGLLDDQATNVLVATAIISISINPLLYRMINPLEQWLLRVVPSLQSTAVHALTDLDHVEMSSGTDRH